VLKEMNIVLIGYRCSGKSTVGRLLAAKTGRVFLDTDELLERRAGKPIACIVSEGGWPLLRRLEREAVKEASIIADAVIGTGGGSVLDHENVSILRKRGWLIWLKTDPEVIRARMEKDEASGLKRPGLTGGDPLEEIRTVLALREHFYRDASDHVIDVGMLSPQETAELIETAVNDLVMRKQGCQETR
jgi:shikimate kinase